MFVGERIASIPLADVSVASWAKIGCGAGRQAQTVIPKMASNTVTGRKPRDQSETLPLRRGEAMLLPRWEECVSDSCFILLNL